MTGRAHAKPGSWRRQIRAVVIEWSLIVAIMGAGLLVLWASLAWIDARAERDFRARTQTTERYAVCEVQKCVVDGIIPLVEQSIRESQGAGQ